MCSVFLYTSRPVRAGRNLPLLHRFLALSPAVVDSRNLTVNEVMFDWLAPVPGRVPSRRRRDIDDMYGTNRGLF